MKKGCFIIPYFGKFNNYFQLFLNSCSTNEDFDWLIFTDDKRAFIYPDNVKVKYCQFDELKIKIQAKFDFEISLNRPYKLCDLKPMYGYIFAEEIAEYSFWGHCDTDLIFGKLSDFITDEDLAIYDKIGIFGHCTLYRNNAEINQLFMKNLNGVARYKDVQKEYWNHSFDEEFKASINNIFEQENKKIRYKEYQANIYTKSSDFKLTKLNDDKIKYSVEKLKKAFFLWDNGVLMRYSLENKKLIVKEYMYIHLQSRPMKVNIPNTKQLTQFKIIPNTFEEIEQYPVTVDNFAGIRRKYFNLHYFRLRSKNLYNKIRKYVTGSKV